MCPEHESNAALQILIWAARCLVVVMKVSQKVLWIRPFGTSFAHGFVKNAIHSVLLGPGLVESWFLSCRGSLTEACRERCIWNPFSLLKAEGGEEGRREGGKRTQLQPLFFPRPLSPAKLIIVVWTRDYLLFPLVTCYFVKAKSIKRNEPGKHVTYDGSSEPGAFISTIFILCLACINLFLTSMGAGWFCTSNETTKLHKLSSIL